MMIECYFKKATHPIQLGETRRPDKLLTVTGNLKDIFETIKQDDDLDKLLYARLDGVVSFHPKDHGFDIYFKSFDDLLEFIPHEFIKREVINKRSTSLLSDRIEYFLQVSHQGYIFAVRQFTEDTNRILYSDSGN